MGLTTSMILDATTIRGPNGLASIVDRTGQTGSGAMKTVRVTPDQCAASRHIGQGWSVEKS